MTREDVISCPLKERDWLHSRLRKQLKDEKQQRLTWLKNQSG